MYPVLLVPQHDFAVEAEKRAFADDPSVACSTREEGAAIGQTAFELVEVPNATTSRKSEAATQDFPLRGVPDCAPSPTPEGKDLPTWLVAHEDQGDLIIPGDDIPVENRLIKGRSQRLTTSV